MPVLNERRFNENLDLARNNIAQVKSIVQELLIHACYKAYKDGNTTPLNRILDMATNSKAVDAARITRWVELHAGIARIKDAKFVLNKKVRDESAVIDEATFEQFETLLRSLPWYDIMPKQKVQSVWELDAYLGNVIKTLEKHLTATGVDEVLREVKAARGKLAQASIE